MKLPGVIRALLCFQARHLSLDSPSVGWLMYQPASWAHYRLVPIACGLMPAVPAVSLCVRLRRISALDSAASVSFNCGQPLYCLLRKIIILPHHKL